MTQPSEPGVFIDRSAPIFYVKVFVAGNPKATRFDVSERVLSFEFDDDEKASNKVEITYDNFDLSAFDDPIWAKGNFLEVSWGYSGNMAPARECVIQSIKGSVVLKICALAQSILMNKKPRARVFEHMTRSQIVKKIANENGYGTTEQTIDDTEVILEHVAQARLTDAQFLKHLAQKEGFEFFVDFDGLHFHRRKMSQKPQRVFTYYTDPGAGDILGFDVCNDVTVIPGKVTGTSRDPLSKKDIHVSADNASTKRDVLAPTVEVIDPQTGASTIRSQAAEATVLTNAKTAASAKREVDGRFIKAQQCTVLLNVGAIGDPRVAAKQVVEFRNISKRLSGKYYLSGVKHKLSNSEYTMEMHARSDGGHGGTGTKTDGSLNTSKPGDKHAMQPIESVDSRTGETSVRYRPGGA